MTYAAAGFASEPGTVSRSLRAFALPADQGPDTSPAIAAMHPITVAWQLSRDEAETLSGASKTAWVRICGGADPLSQDQLTRIATMTAIFKALHALFGGDIGDRWVRLPNNAPVFADRSPLQTMIDDGIPGMIEVRRYLDGLRGGM